MEDSAAAVTTTAPSTSSNSGMILINVGKSVPNSTTILSQISKNIPADSSLSFNASNSAHNSLHADATPAYGSSRKYKSNLPVMNKPLR